MTTDRKTSIALGILLVAGIAFGIASSVPALEVSDWLVKLASIRTQVLWAVFFQACMASVYVCVAALLYPVIERYSRPMALTYYGFRIIGAAFLFAGMTSLLVLLFVSQSFVAAGQPSASSFQTIGELLRLGRDWLNHGGMILPWVVGGVLLYYCFLRTRLVPTWLSVWGLIGAALTLLATLLYIFDVIGMATPVYLIMNAPSALFELTLAMWLLAKGFNPPAPAPGLRPQLRGVR